jgi:hypothetical protein
MQLKHTGRALLALTVVLATIPATASSMPSDSATLGGGQVAVSQDLRSPDARDGGLKPVAPVPGLPTWPLNPEPIAPAPVDAAPVADSDDGSTLAYVLPGIVVSVLLAAGMAYALRASARTRRTRISA